MMVPESGCEFWDNNIDMCLCCYTSGRSILWGCHDFEPAEEFFKVSTKRQRHCGRYE